ncbi:MAG TPA: transporter substrate-binding domain-containing protein [Epsilonproteobacteria bacterium]|nr:transporter substrate-binding domain-containing protein [Campylobacterota bacterium]
MNLLLSYILRVFLFFAFTFSFLSALDLTSQEKTWIAQHKQVSVGVDTSWEPFDFINDKGKHDGMSEDYLRLISQITGLDFSIAQYQKWTEVLAAAKSKHLDMIAALTPSDKRSEYLNFTDPYMKYAFVLATADNNNFFYDISDFNGKRVGVVKSYITEEIIKEKYPQINVIKYDNLTTLLNGLANNEVDAIFDNAVSLAYHIKEEGYANFRMLTIGEEKRSITMGVRKDKVLLLSILNKALKSISSEEKQKIRDKWVSFQYDKTMDYSLVYKILGIFLLFVLGTFYWYRKLMEEAKKRKESEAQMRMLIDNIPLNVIVSGYDGSVFSANAFALQTFSIAPEDIYSHNVMEFYTDTLEREDIIETIKKEGKVSNRIVKFRRLDSSEMDIMISIIPIVYDGEKALLSIMVDLTERIGMEEDLRKAKEIADSANKSKSEFLANMSHEIRTPMNAIIGFTELLNEEIKETRLKGYVKTIKNAGYTLLTLINDILDLSKIEAGKLEIRKHATNLYDLSEEVLSIFIMSVRDKDVDLILDIDSNLPKSILIDDVRLRQILVNLIGNAVKFTDEGYIKLKISACNVDDHLSKLDLEIIVEDTGIGISENQLENIFQSFEQQEGQDSRKFGGTGLGLSISKRLTEMMGGKVSVKSIKSKGSKFFLYFSNVDISSIQMLNKVDDNKRLKAKNIRFKPAKILVVDDIQDNRELIIKSFEHTSLSVTTAVDGYDAIKQYKEEQPDIILMDIRMPNMDGYEAARKIRELNSTVPMIALTASLMKDEYERTKSKDFSAYLRKPVLRDELFLELSHFLAHDKIEVIPEERQMSETFDLSEYTLLHRVKIVDEMQEIIQPIYEKAKSSNNIAEIKAFTEKVNLLAEKYHIEILQRYVVKLDEAIDIFDIAQIQALLVEYSKIQIQWESL